MPLTVVLFRPCRIIAAGLLLLGAATAAEASSPSFDCARARADVEKLICSDDELAALDQQLAKNFANALAKAPASAVNGLKDSHRSWRRSLMNCARTDDARGCTVDAYRQRLSEF